MPTSNRSSTGFPEPTLRVGYLMTHYPRPTQSFVLTEVRQMRTLGAEVHTFSLNHPDVSEISAPGMTREAAATVYLKDGIPRSALMPMLRAVREAGPASIARLAWRAVRLGGTDAKVVLWRIFQLVEGARLWDECRSRGIRHLHAQFALAPATVTMFAAEIGRAAEPGKWTWGFTIHGFHDFVNEPEARIDVKAASADYVVCIADYIRAQTLRVIDPQHWPKVHLVYCGIELRGSETPRTLGSHVPRIVTVARLSSEKGHLILLQAVARLRDTGIDVHVTLVGNGPAADQLRSECERLGLDERVEFLGELDSTGVRHQLERADIFCLPSFSEGLPISIMEAIDAGLPVVSTLIGGIPELITDGETGLTVPAGRADLLADAIMRLIEDASLRQQLASAARSRLIERHSASSSALQLFQVLTKRGELS